MRKVKLGILALANFFAGAFSDAHGQLGSSWLSAIPIIMTDTIWHDSGESDGPRSGNRLASTQDQLYFANGRSLIYGSILGTPWMKFSPPPSGQPSASAESMPLAAAPVGGRSDIHGTLVLWGNWRTRNGGEDWERLGFPQDRFLAYAIASSGAGLCLGGGNGERIERSLDSGRTWTQVHAGNTSGSVKQLLFGDYYFRNWAFAVLHPEGLLHSRDSGVTWSRWEALTGPDSAYGVTAVAFTESSASELFHPILWVLQRDRRTGGSRLLRHLLRENLTDTVGIPDSAITCLSARESEVILGGKTLTYVGRAGTGMISWQSLAPLPEPGAVEIHIRRPETSRWVLTHRNLYLNITGTAVKRVKLSSKGKLSFRPPQYLLNAGSGSVRYLPDGRRSPSGQDPLPKAR